jgi:hypothetical protein
VQPESFIINCNMLHEVFAVSTAQLNIWHVLFPFLILNGLLCRNGPNISISVSVSHFRACPFKSKASVRIRTTMRLEAKARKYLHILTAMLYKGSGLEPIKLEQPIPCYKYKHRLTMHFTETNI